LLHKSANQNKRLVDEIIAVAKIINEVTIKPSMGFDIGKPRIKLSSTSAMGEML
jgi:hypothetical protein